MELGRSVEAETFADRICSLWPDSEDGYILRLRTWSKQQGHKNDKGSHITDRRKAHIYLSADARKTVEFWKEDDGFRERRQHNKKKKYCWYGRPDIWTYAEGHDSVPCHGGHTYGRTPKCDL